jgi:hypothetical protein
MNERGSTVTTGHRWLRGCVLGCAVLLLVGIGACVIGILYLGHTFRGIEKADESYDTLVAELGPVKDYVPPVDGVPHPDRLGVFVSVREAIDSERLAVDKALARLPGLEGQEGSTLGRIRVGLGTLGDLIDAMGVYLQARNRALLERGMGAGEYVYVYTLVYHSWLRHPPAEGPEVRAVPEGVRVQTLQDDDPLFGEEAVRHRYRRYVLGMLERQAASLETSEAPETGGGWTATLKEEIRQMEMDPGRVLWRDGPPPAIEASLEPFRGRLEATWSSGTNRLELPLAEHEVPWEWQ